MSLLYAKHPIVINPELASAIGLNEAILLQQLHYWLSETSSGVEREGRRWIYNTHREWKEKCFDFFSESTIKRTFASLVSQGLIDVRRLSDDNRDRTNFYTINYGNKVLSGQVNLTSCNRSERTNAKGQTDPVQEVRLDPCTGSDRSLLHTETTTDITTDIKRSCPVRSEPDEISTTPAEMVLGHFNRVTKSSYRDSKTTMGYIRGRLSEPEYSADDLILVTDYATAKWLNDPKMCDYLRPKTLFGPENFSEYHQKALKWNEAGRPECINGTWLKPGRRDINKISEPDNTIPPGFRG
ncbi:conserved phage C-terminal domain-containing protein [Lelliottia wanjuensis]|uniref:conserved phage C-terminal domain-containing protein n=1 Tax=Lelliottia wanjuensis TaxID=3050585 RepID=UPI00254ED1F4|nr:conserved phage C-terminal domain-containing protein [Lelliottia sp. V86_10]MDK9585446.1 conserved phage C-terminal domain-containing protein [Lelliottia sp. V86_10]